MNHNSLKSLNLFWAGLLEHSTRNDAADVAEWGLQTLVESTGYAPNVRVLRELSTPLVHVKDPVRARSLVRNFDGQGTTVEGQGPTEEVVRLQLNLAVAESLYDEEACANRLVEAYLSVQELTDLSTKSSCLARILSTLQVVDRSGSIEAKEHLGTVTHEELGAAIAELLDQTAEQFYVTQRIIRSLASFDGDKSLELARNLNTESRREDALLLAIDAVLESDSDRIDLKNIRAAYDDLRKTESRDHVAVSVAEFVAREGSINSTPLIRSGFELFQDVFFSIADPMMQCKVLCLLHGLGEKGLYTASEAECFDIPGRIEKALGDIEPGWRRIDAGLRVGHSLADWNPELARQYLSDADDSRKRSALGSYSSEWAYQACLRLAIRAFAGQLGDGYDPKEDISRLGKSIDHVPSPSLRAELWGELAMRLFLRQHTDAGSGVMTKNVLPLIESMDEGAAKSSAIIAMSPALYRYHKSTAFGLFRDLEEHQRNKALITCAEFILERRVPSDPYEAHDNGYDIEYKDAVDIIELAEEIDHDSLVYSVIVALADTLSSARLASRFTRQQQADLVLRLEGLIDTKFPDRNNIRHDGYAIASEAQLLRFHRHGRIPWLDVLNRARSIPNISDRAYVLAIIAQVIPNREASRRESVFEEAMQNTEAIPCTYDRLMRLNDLAGMMTLKCPQLARKCLHNAIVGFREGLNGPVSRVFRNMIDTAFKIDPDFAASLASLADDDPARAVARHEMKRRLETLRTKKAIIDEPQTSDRFENKSRDIPRSAWLALGSLNAGRTNPVRVDQLRQAVRAAGRYPLRDAFPIFAWVIENATRRFAGSSQSRSGVRVIYEAGIHATNLAQVAAINASATVRKVISSAIAPTGDESVWINVGERERAEEFIRNWLESSDSGVIYICDQYFGVKELDLVKLIQSVIQTVEVKILTSLRYQNERNYFPLYESYKTEWQRISAQEPPKVEIVAVGFEDSGKSPIHDRYLLAESGGIKIGTSWNSIGLSQGSTLNILSEAEAIQFSEEVLQFLLESVPE